MVLALALAGWVGPAAGQEVMRAPYSGGDSISVQVVPDGRPPLRFERESGGTWVFRGDTTPLVGKSYVVRVGNQGKRRIKVVVGVDGVNVYFRKPIVGSADGDIGSILGPGQNRELTGFQADERTAQRFVFSPPEYSEGQPVRGARIGEIEVHVYEEYRTALGRGTAEERNPAQAGAPPNIGTTAGEDVDSDIKRVRFTASTREPIMRMLLVYGRPAEPVVNQRQGGSPDRLGIEAESHPDGLRVVRVERDSLADEVGLRAGDVIAKVDSQPRPSEATLRQVLRAKGSGDYLFIEVLRGRHVVSIKIRL